MIPSHPPLEAQKQFWDGRWEHVRAPNEWALRRADVALAIIGSLGFDRPRILDVGCGTGWFAEKLASFAEVTGLDLSETAIALARSRVPQATFVAGNVYVVPIPREHFDVAVSMEVLSHVEDQRRYVERVADFLRPGGYLILTTDNKFVWDRMDWEHGPPEHIADFLTRRQLTRLLRRRFGVLRTMTTIPAGHRGILRIVNSHKLNAALGRLISPSRLDAIKERVGLGCSHVILARKRA